MEFNVGVIFGMVISLVVFTNVTETMEQSEFDKCESKLPRTQHCIVVAVPYKKKSGEVK